MLISFGILIAYPAWEFVVVNMAKIVRCKLSYLLHPFSISHSSKIGIGMYFFFNFSFASFNSFSAW